MSRINTAHGILKLFSTILTDPSTWVLIGVSFTTVAAIYRLYFSPLAKIPGPWIAALTRLWIMYHEFKGDRTITIHRLHEQYGPVVRISPNEVSFNNQDALKEIYGIKSEYSKGDFYELFVYYNERNTFTSLGKSEHATKKRLVAEKYTKSYIMQPAVSESVRKHAAAFMDHVKQNAVIDVYIWLHYFAMDVITNHLYGACGTQTLSNPSHRPLVHDLSGEKHRTRLYLIYYFNALMSLSNAVLSFIDRLKGASSDFHVRGTRLSAYGKDAIASFRTNLLGKDNISACSKLFAAVPDNDAQIAAECMDHLVAGVDTTGDAMCVLMWKLSTPEYRHIQDKLSAELRPVAYAFDEQTMTAPASALDSLPYLDSIIHEGLRWRPPTPLTLFRVVPAGGRIIATYPIPAGTTVGCQAYSLHRLPQVFENPEKFDPERWMTEDKAKLSAMRTHFWPFASGPRHCLGHNIAMLEMKMILASVYMYYRTRTTLGCTEESMRMDDQLTSAVPHGMKCVLEFERRTRELV